MAKKKILSPEELAEKKECIAILVALAEKLGRPPIKTDTAGPEETLRIKRALGPWPRALEAAGLKAPRERKAIRKERQRKKQVKAEAFRAAKAVGTAKTKGTD
ncbi:MAG: hypothetical protein LBK56_09945 [Gracilibacteraceae bacterium]|jgi:hypothetical protein|nr:hypothetical protein [Gracilibacteraceae bacterium]